jgi:hypothetical protein
VKEFLSVRTSPSVKAEVIGKLYPNQTIHVHEIRNGWATIIFNGKYAYVNASYLKVISDSAPATSTERHNRRNKNMTEPFFYGMLVMLGLFLLTRMYVNFYNTNFFAFIFILVCVLEIVYYFGFDNLGIKDLLSLNKYDHPLWFTDPGSVGLIWGIVNSFIYYIVAMLQVVIFFTLIEDCYDSSCSLGYYSAIIFVIAYGFTEWLILSNMLQKIFIIALIVCQAIQFFILIKQGFRGAIIYTVCISATILVYLQITGWFMFIIKYIAK